MFQKLTTSFSVSPTGIPEPNSRYTFSVHTKFKNYLRLLGGVLTRQLLIPHNHLQFRLVLHLTVTRLISILQASASYMRTTVGELQWCRLVNPGVQTGAWTVKSTRLSSSASSWKISFRCAIFMLLWTQINTHQIFKRNDHYLVILIKKSHKILPLKLSVLSSNLMSSFLQVLFAHFPHRHTFTGRNNYQRVLINPLTTYSSSPPNPQSPACRSILCLLRQLVTPIRYACAYLQRRNHTFIPNGMGSWLHRNASHHNTNTHTLQDIGTERLSIRSLCLW